MKFTSDPVTESLSPAPDGFTVLFHASVSYAPGTTTLWVNGIRKIANLDDGYIEVPPTAVRLTEAPWIGDTLQIRYTPAP